MPTKSRNDCQGRHQLCIPLPRYFISHFTLIYILLCSYFFMSWFGIQFHICHEKLCINKHLDLIFEKSSCKNQVWQTGFSDSKNQFWNWFSGYTGSKNPVRNRIKIQFVELDFSKLILQKLSTDHRGDKILIVNSINKIYLTIHWISSVFTSL